jgi:hypothetical protein
MWPLHVGGQPLIPGPPTIVIFFEMIMLGMLVSTFLGVFLDSRFPSYSPKEYVPEISDGRIAVFFECPVERKDQFIQAMQASGADPSTSGYKGYETNRSTAADRTVVVSFWSPLFTCDVIKID